MPSRRAARDWLPAWARRAASMASRSTSAMRCFTSSDGGSGMPSARSALPGTASEAPDRSKFLAGTSAAWARTTMGSSAMAGAASVHRRLGVALP